ncbi:MAG: hypothetical protein JW894_03495 [Bacteroidales bacterium]|nr:hypothetical protein [Bacteroidales bacterium]
MITKAFIVAGLLMIISVYIIKAQHKDENTPAPGGNYKVEKEYDENGNLIHYDSVYTYSWNSGDSTIIDSLFGNWDESFFPNQSFLFNHDFLFDFDNDPFFTLPDDSIQNKSPGNRYSFNDDWTVIEEQMRQHMQEMERMMQKMQQYHDEMFREFRQHQYPFPSQPDSFLYKQNKGNYNNQSFDIINI